jgi:hypothetical protein
MTRVFNGAPVGVEGLTQPPSDRDVPIAGKLVV